MAALKTIRIISRGRLPHSPREEIYIRDNGKAKYSYVKYQADGKSIVKKFKVKKKALEKIEDAVKKHKFFTLSSFDSGYLDGDEVQMSVSKGSKQHTVVLTNYRLPAFNKIILRINKVLPKRYRVYFNALNSKLYK